jgi:Spy/CpxP family protein refolding chaperone
MEMEKILMDLVNARIAVFKSGEGKLKSAVTDLEKLYEELKLKGASETSEDAQKLRDLLNKTVADSKSAINQANASYEEVLTKVKDNYTNLSAQIETMVPAQVKETVQKGIDELNKLIKKG